MRETIHYTPHWLEAAVGDDKKARAKLPSFTLRMGSVLERESLDGELEGTHRAQQVASWLMLEAAINGIRALLDPADAEQMEALLRSAHGADGAQMSSVELGQVQEAEGILSEHWPEYRHLAEQNAQHDRLAPVLAFQRYCTGWENVKDGNGKPVVYERNARGDIPDHVLRRVPPIMIRAAGFKAFNLQYGMGEEKN